MSENVKPVRVAVGVGPGDLPDWLVLLLTELARSRFAIVVAVVECEEGGVELPVARSGIGAGAVLARRFANAELLQPRGDVAAAAADIALASEGCSHSHRARLSPRSAPD